MYVDVKKTKWVRIQLPKVIEDKIARELRLSNPRSGNYMYELFEKYGYDIYDFMEDLDDEDYMYVTENSGNPTMELHFTGKQWSDRYLMWDNTMNIKEQFKTVNIL